MLIGTLVKTSLVDYPSRVAASVFLHGCNMRCPYCHNKELVTGTTDDYEAVSFDDIIAHLEKRKNVLSGFVISGGEALLSPILTDLIRAAKKLGYAVKLDTNGTLPDRLEHILQNTDTSPDFIALDVKTSPERYIELFAQSVRTVTMQKTMEKAIIESIRITAALEPDRREYRTVLVPGFVDRSVIETVGSMLPKDASWQLASFRPGNCIDSSFDLAEPFTSEYEKELLTAARAVIPGAQLR